MQCPGYWEYEGAGEYYYDSDYEPPEFPGFPCPEDEEESAALQDMGLED